MQHPDGMHETDPQSGAVTADGDASESGQEFGSTVCLIEMRLPTESAKEGIGLLCSGIGHAEAMTGCRSCTVTRDAIEEGRVFYREEWATKAAFVRRLQSEEFRRVLTVMDICSSKPEVRIGTLSGRSGLDYLGELWESPSAPEA